MTTIVSYYTPAYELDASRLVTSLVKFKLRHDVTAIETLGSWSANTGHKAAFMQQQRERHTGPIVWLDADAEVVKYPLAFDVLDGCDIAVHFRRDNELLSGTLYVGDTPKAREVLAAWVRRCEQFPSEWDQRNLQAALGMVPGVNLHKLPAAYTCIFDADDMLEQGEPVILHHQASRRLRHKA